MDHDPEDKLVFGKQTFTYRIEGKVSSKYDPVKELGHGSYGKVYRVKNKFTGELRACKQLSKAKISDIPKFNLEIDILCKTDHPNIIRLYEIYEDLRYFYLIMEECVGGELFERIIKRINAKQMFSEKQAAAIFTELMSAICYCHSQHIIHRDLKPENILFLNEDEKSPIKVIDFGLSKMHNVENPKEKIKMKTKVGTPYYVSPEVLKGDYDEKCDIWSAGVILYLLLSGEPPFNGANDNAIYRSITRKKFSFPEKNWKNISAEVKDLINHMLCDADKRLTAQQVLQHDWITKIAPNNTIDLNLDVESLDNYKNSYKLKKAVITYIASRLKDSDISDLIKVFEGIDKNKDGTITLDEMKEGIEKLNVMIDIDIAELFNSIDTDKSGSISYTEFIAASMDQKVYMKEERLFEAFKTFDKDNSGKISKEELKQVLKAELVDLNDFEVIINQFDKDGDGEIDYNEFLSMMNEQSKKEYKPLSCIDENMMFEDDYNNADDLNMMPEEIYVNENAIVNEESNNSGNVIIKDQNNSTTDNEQLTKLNDNNFNDKSITNNNPQNIMPVDLTHNPNSIQLDPNTNQNSLLTDPNCNQKIISSDSNNTFIVNSNQNNLSPDPNNINNQTSSEKKDDVTNTVQNNNGSNINEDVIIP